MRNIESKKGPMEEMLCLLIEFSLKASLRKMESMHASLRKIESMHMSNICVSMCDVCMCVYERA